MFTSLEHTMIARSSVREIKPGQEQKAPQCECSITAGQCSVIQVPCQDSSTLSFQFHVRAETYSIPVGFIKSFS